MQRPRSASQRQEVHHEVMAIFACVAALELASQPLCSALSPLGLPVGPVSGRMSQTQSSEPSDEGDVRWEKDSEGGWRHRERGDGYSDDEEEQQEEEGQPLAPTQTEGDRVPHVLLTRVMAEQAFRGAANLEAEVDAGTVGTCEVGGVVYYLVSGSRVMSA